MNTSVANSEKCIRLRDGRSLGYAEFGSPTGYPIFLFNGSVSRLFYPLDDTVAISANARIITVERPGIGLSTFKPNRTLLDWPADLAELADALGLHQFAIAGASAGGPYAAACACKLPHRVTALALISSLAPFDVPEISKGMTPLYRLLPAIVKYGRWLLNFGHWLTLRFPESAWKQIYSRLPDCDKAILRAHPELNFKEALLKDVAEIYRNGFKGTVWESILLTRPWGFSPTAITVKTFLWQGKQDLNVPPKMGQFLAKSIPNCTAQFIPNEGHLMYMNHWQEILFALCGRHAA
ncbi:MAG: alpha/beta hydrolase [Thermosynechococcaceae cyanobacterium]